MKKGAKAVIVVVVVVVIVAAAALALLPRFFPDSPLARLLPKPPAGQAGARRGPAQQPQGEFAVPVAVVAATAGPARETLLLYGSVFARKEVSIFSPVAGKVKELRVQAGDPAARDQVLAVIDRDQAGLKFANAEVTSTIDGVVKAVLTESGATVSPAAPLFQVVDVGTVEVAVSVPEKRIGRIRAGLPAQVSVVSYPGRSFSGAVSKLNPVLDPASRTLETRIRVDNSAGALKPGMFAEVRILLRQEAQIVRVPLAVLIDRNEGQVAFVVRENRAREVAVRTAFLEGDTAAVENGIAAGDRVVVVGQQNLNDGDEVTVVEETEVKITDLSVKRPVTVIVVCLALAVLGAFSLGRLAIDLIPNISFPVIVIFTSYPGVSPEEVEENLTKPIENAAASASRVEKITSTSSEGSSFVIVNYQWGTDLADASNDLRERLDLIRDFIPDDATQPVLFKFDPSMTPIMILSVEGRRDPASLRYIAETTVKTNLEQIDGVASVAVSGGVERQINVDLDRALLASYGLTIDQVVGLLRAENLNVTGGSVVEGARKYSLRTLGKFSSPESIRGVTVGNKGGRAIRLEDIAAVYSGEVDDEADVLLDRNPTIILRVQKQSGTNTVQIAERVKERLAKLRQSLPGDIRLVEVFAPSSFISGAITNVWQTALIGGLLAIVILFLFLRNIPTTLIVGVSIPLSIVITIIAMYFANLTLNMLSLGGLALGIGMLVDNSIVIIENIFRYRESGVKPAEAARHGTLEMGNAVMASTLTTVAVFLPLVLFIRGLARELFRDLAFTVTFSLLASLGVALTVVPMLSSRIRAVKVRQKSNTLLNVEEELAARGPVMRFVDRVYRASLAWTLRRRWVVVVGTLLLFGVSLALIPRVGVELIPQTDQGDLNLNISTAIGSDLDTTRAAVDRIYQDNRGERPGEEVRPGAGRDCGHVLRLQLR